MMWNDEDNNPYGSFGHRESESSDVADPSSPTSRLARSSTSPSRRSSSSDDSPELIAQAPDYSNSDDGKGHEEAETGLRKKGHYDSRIEQILYEHPDLVISIVHAGKNLDSGSYIAYTIRTGDVEVRRRYSEFNSLRQTLVNLHPTLIIPPIPEKHSMADYAAKPTRAKEDVAIIDLRKRMLAVFLNRCKRMRDVREDGVFWRFLDPNASWSEVLLAHPVSSLPKSNLKSPPLDPANPTPGHNFLPIPSSTAKLKSAGSKETTASGTPVSASVNFLQNSTNASSGDEPQVFARFPPNSANLSEQELDPYFADFESSSRELEQLLQGNLEKVNRRTMSHLGSFSEDLAELGARFNGFSLSEQSVTLAAAIEKIGQAVDSTYIATSDLSASLSAGFSEPMRESAQFAGIVRSVLRYRVLKRVQEEMTRDELDKKRALLDSLERSELEARRIEQYLSTSQTMGNSPRRSTSSNAPRSSSERHRSEEDTASIDSDFPPTHGDPQNAPSSTQGAPQAMDANAQSPQRKSTSGNFVTNKIFGRINHAIHGIVDVDPERTRRDQIGKTRESLVQLEQALEVSGQDVKDASSGVLKSLREFQVEKEEDLRRYMVAYARCHIDWAKRNMASWEEAKAEVVKIDTRAPDRDS